MSLNALKITVVGTGYVGLVSGTCFASLGHHVTCVDNNPSKIDALQNGSIPIYEPGLDKLVAENVLAGRLTFTTNLEHAMKGSKAVFIAVGTPTSADGVSADLSYVYGVAKTLAPMLHDYTVIVTKSTVPVMTNAEIEAIIRQTNPDAKFDICSNPEFLREGAAIEDFLQPDRIVVGVRTDHAKALMHQLYLPLLNRNVPLVWTTPESAELIKYAANAFLATKITFINEVADLCEKIGAEINTVAQGIGLDSRIGPKFLQAGPGYGGSCFPKDTRAMAYVGRQYDTVLSIVETVIESNDARKKAMTDRIINACGGSVKGKQIAILGLAFKAHTDDMRESVVLDIIPELIHQGATINAYDPAATEQAKPLLPDNVHYCDSMAQTVRDTDALVVATEWPEFRMLDLMQAAKAMRTPVLVDLRNLMDMQNAIQAGFDYYPIGRSPLVVSQLKKKAAS
ncbi:MAG TPA: UDP-glucose/GDP-mannose dehydrogenase family protein [Alphaproteobacteria bacterium]